MFKAVNNLREQKGFTLIELLIVIAIIGILAAIAIPAFLGQREKAKNKAMEASARGMLSEVQSRLDDYVLGQAMVFIKDATGTQVCYQHVDVTSTEDKNSCNKMFSMPIESTYSTLTEILNWTKVEHNTGKNENSPYTGQDLVEIDTDGTCNLDNKKGNVSICNTTDYTIKVLGVDRDGAEVYNGVVSAK